MLNNDISCTTFTDIETHQTVFAYELIAASKNAAAGFIDYNDASTGETPITLLPEIWTDVPNDGLGAFTNKTYFNTEVYGDIMDFSTGYIKPQTLPLGSSLLIRNDYTITPQANNSLLSFRYFLGAAAGEYTLQKSIGRLDSGSGVGYRQALNVDLIYMGDENTRDNDVRIQVKLSSAGTLVNAGSVLKVF